MKKSLFLVLTALVFLTLTGTAMAQPYTVTYNGNEETGGTVPTDGDSPYTAGAVVTVLGLGDLVKTNNRFYGWQRSDTLTLVQPDSTFAMPAENVTLTAQWSPNLVVNGDFSLGNTGFTTSYTFHAAKPPDMGAGRYGVSDRAVNLHDAFSTNFGNTTGVSGDNYFIANGGDGSETEIVWRTPAVSPIVVNEDLIYRFEAYVTKVFPANPPILRFQLGDGTSWVDLGDSPAIDDADTGEWVFTFADGRFSDGGNFFLRLINMETAEYGNDFGIDDIYFGIRTEAPSFEDEPGVPDDDVRTFTVGAPNVTAGGTTQFKRLGAVAVAPTIEVNDASDARWNGGSLQVQISDGSEGIDVLSLPTANPGGGAIWIDGMDVKTNDTIIGTADAVFVSGDTAWIIDFNASSTNALVQNTARAILFNNPNCLCY